MSEVAQAVETLPREAAERSPRGDPAGSSRRWVAVRIAAGLCVAGVIVAAGLWLHEQAAYGPAFSFTLAAGAAFGIALQRSRFCFFCLLRDFFERRDSRGVLGILAALAAGSIGYLVVFGAWIPDPQAGHLPWEGHIAPAGWHLLLGGVIFGVGMSLSGSCISGHMYRVGEGSLVAPIALVGTFAGFVLAFRSWNWFYLEMIQEAPVVWLPERLGYLGAASAQLLALGLLAAALLRFVGPVTKPEDRSPPGLKRAWQAVFVDRWPTWLGGIFIGALATFTYLRTAPLGVTAEIGRLSRRLAEATGTGPDRLEGLETMRGCIVEAVQAISSNGVFVLALMAGALSVGLMGGQFRPRRETLVACGMALAGGVLLGYGAMISLGCTIGTLLSGIHAFSLSGWLFFAGVVAGVGASLPLRRRWLPPR